MIESELSFCEFRKFEFAGIVRYSVWYSEKIWYYWLCVFLWWHKETMPLIYHANIFDWFRENMRRDKLDFHFPFTVKIQASRSFSTILNTLTIDILNKSSKTTLNNDWQQQSICGPITGDRCEKCFHHALMHCWYPSISRRETHQGAPGWHQSKQDQM